MKFEEVYDLLAKYQRERGGWYAVLGEQALRDIFQHITATGAKDCLELGTAFGATACVMAAAVEENGGGTVTTIDDGPRSLRARHRAQGRLQLVSAGSPARTDQGRCLRALL
jgi:predicted O-methyltransferase YrrM